MLGERNSDGRRRAAETEFYEHKDENGIIRRTSLIRTLDKDDKLVVRGANPRTGMITPTDTISLAGSASSEKKRSRVRSTPSAKWKLQGDQWVSINHGQIKADTQGKVLGGSHKARRCASENVSRSRPWNQKMVKSLTSENLVALEKVVKQEQIQANASQDDFQLRLPKVRRKAVGRPPKSTAKLTDSTRVRDRNASDDTVVRRRFVPEQSHKLLGQSSRHDYFSPDNVGRDSARHLRMDRSDHSFGERSFLGMAVKSPARTQLQSRGFTVTNEGQHSLWPDLQMNGGPYLSKFLINQQVLSPDYLHNRTMNTVEKRDSKRDHESLTRFPPLAQRASHPNGATFPVQKPQHPAQGSCSPRHARLQTGCLQLGPMETLGEDPQPLSWTPESPLKQKSSITFTSTGMSTHMFSEHANLGRNGNTLRSSPTMGKYSSLMSTKFEDQFVLVESQPRRMKDISGITVNSQQNMQNLSRSIPLQSRNAETTTTEFEDLSRKTGTASQGDHVTPMARKDPKLNILRDTSLQACSTSAHSDVTFPCDQVLIPYEAVGEAEVDDTSSMDHSKCCSECCDQFGCHESCLGHSSLDALTEKSDASSFTSAGIFDENFQTSVKVVNEALLTDWKNNGSKLMRVKNAFIQGWRYGLGISPKSRTHEDSMKKTLRLPPVRQRYDPTKRQPERPVLSRAKNRNVGNAQTAAQIAMCEEKQVNNFSKSVNLKQSRPLLRARSPQTPRSKKESWKLSDAKDCKNVRISDMLLESSEVRRDFDKPRASGSIRSESGNVNIEFHKKQSDMKLDPVHDSKSRNLLDLQSINSQYKVIDQAQAVGKRIHQMSLVVLETIFIVARMISKYNQDGEVSLPEGMSAFEFWRNCLRSVLCLVIAACAYALILRVSRIMWSFLKLLLIPVRVYAWIVG